MAQRSDADTSRPDSAIGLHDDYVLTRDAAASARLNLSHYIWHASFGFHLHPRIRDDLAGRAEVSIADVGTGTGFVHAPPSSRIPSLT